MRDASKLPAASLVSRETGIGYNRVMVLRAWLLLSALWALAFIANGLTKEHITALDYMIALGPLVLGYVALRGLRFIVQGR